MPSQLLGTDAFQESDVIGISMPVTKWNYQITSSDEIGEIISKAFYIAKSGRPGPVLIDITKDAQFSEVDFNYDKCERIRSYHPYPIIKEKKIIKASKLINKAKEEGGALQGVIRADQTSRCGEVIRICNLVAGAGFSPILATRSE